MKIIIGILSFPFIVGILFNIVFWTAHFVIGAAFILAISPFNSWTMNFSQLLPVLENCNIGKTVFVAFNIGISGVFAFWTSFFVIIGMVTDEEI